LITGSVPRFVDEAVNPPTERRELCDRIPCRNPVLEPRETDSL